MVTIEPAELTASETGLPGFSIRWGWFLGCVAGLLPDPLLITDGFFQVMIGNQVRATTFR